MSDYTSEAETEAILADPETMAAIAEGLADLDDAIVWEKTGGPYKTHDITYLACPAGSYRATVGTSDGEKWNYCVGKPGVWTHGDTPETWGFASSKSVAIEIAEQSLRFFLSIGED